MANYSPFRAAFLSFLLPGLGQLYCGRRSHGISFLCTAAGIWIALFLAMAGPPAMRSQLTCALLVLVYPFVWLPAIFEAYQQADGVPSNKLLSQKKGYVIFMLLTVGPAAVPMLWANLHFSRRAKIVWTVIILALFFSSLLLMLFMVPAFERLAETIGISL